MLHLRRRAGVRSRAPRYADGSTDHDRCARRAADHVRKRDDSDSGLCGRPMYPASGCLLLLLSRPGRGCQIIAVPAVPAAQSRGRPRRLRPDRLRPACGLPRSGCQGQTRRRRRCCARPRRPGPDRLRPASAPPQSGHRGRSRTWRCLLSLQDLFRYPRRTAWPVHGQA